MPQWKDLSQWMKVTLATLVCHEGDLLTFNVNMHPDLEAQLVATGSVRQRLSERVRKHVSRAIGRAREYFFVIEGHSARTGRPTYLHIHGAIAIGDQTEEAAIKQALLKALGQDKAGRRQTPRSVVAKPFERIRAAYPDYLFKFTLRRDPRLDERRLVMSRTMTQAAAMFWHDMTRGPNV